MPSIKNNVKINCLCNRVFRKHTNWQYWHYCQFCTFIYLPPTTKLGQGNIFRSVCQEFCLQGGTCVAGGVHGRGTCMAGRGLYSRGTCVVGGMHGRGRCAWQGSMHGRGTCMARGCVWHTANEWAVHILPECILVVDVNGY